VSSLRRLLDRFEPIDRDEAAAITDPYGWPALAERYRTVLGRLAAEGAAAA